MLLVDPAGSISRMSAVFPLAGPRPHFEPTDNEAEVIVVGFSTADLVASVPLFDETRSDALAVRQGTACDGTHALFADDLRDTAVPDTARVLRAPLTGGQTEVSSVGEVRAIDDLVVTVPIGFGRCRQLGLEPFAATERAIDVPVTIDGVAYSDAEHTHFIGVARVDDRYVVARAGPVLYLVERGVAWQDRPGGYLLGTDVGAGWFHDVRVDSRGRVVIAGERYNGSGAVWIASVESGSLAVVETSTITDEAIFSILVEEDGSMIALTAMGGVRVATPAGVWRRVFEQMTRVPLRVMATGDPSVPHLVGARDAVVYTGDLVRGVWSSSTLNRPGTEVFSIFGVAVTNSNDGRWLWGGGLRGLFRSRDGASWQDVLLDFPPQLLGCADVAESCGRARLAEGFPLISQVTGGLVAGGIGCSSVAVLREDGCVDSLDRAGGVRRVDWGESFRAVDTTGKALLAGDRGLLLEADLR